MRNVTVAVQYLHMDGCVREMKVGVRNLGARLNVRGVESESELESRLLLAGVGVGVGIGVRVGVGVGGKYSGRKAVPEFTSEREERHMVLVHSCIRGSDSIGVSL